MSINEETIYTTMLSTLVQKFGVMLTTAQCADALAISTRNLDERRKANKDCPSYIVINNRTIYYPVQNVVQYQIEKAKKSIQIA